MLLGNNFIREFQFFKKCEKVSFLKIVCPKYLNDLVL